jgi:hypothetical protein
VGQEFLDLLARLAPGERPERLTSMAGLLGAMKDWLGSILNSLKDASAQQELLAYFSSSTLAGLKNGHADAEQLTPELLEWARSLYSEEEIRASIEEALRTGGKELSEFIHELE